MAAPCAWCGSLALPRDRWYFQSQREGRGDTTLRTSRAPWCPCAPQVLWPDRPMAAGPSSGVAHTRHPRPSPPAPSLIRSVEYFSTYVKATTDGGGSRCQGDAPKNSPTPPTFPSAAGGTEGWRDGRVGRGMHKGTDERRERVIEMDRGIFGGMNGEEE